MQANQKATVTDVSQQAELQSELDVIETKIKNNQTMSKVDVKFVGELGWLTAAAMLVAGVAASI